MRPAWTTRLENSALVAALAALVLLPIVEIALRATFRVGIEGAGSLTQHLALVAGMAGAAVAAREGRLLSLSTMPSLLTGIRLAAARSISGVVASAVAALLFVASLQFVLAERGGGNVIAYGVPVWVGEAVLPLGFGLIAIRLALAISQPKRAGGD